MFSPFSGSDPVIFLSPKVVFTNKESQVHFAAGGIVVFSSPGDNRVEAGSLYALSTFGNDDHNITIGAGVGFFDGDIANLPAIQLGGMTRIGKRLMFVSDHLLVSDNDNSEIAGTWTFRFIARSYSIDLGAAILYGEGTVPVVGGSFRF